MAAALVAPWRGTVGAARLAVLQDRALRILTQGHLAQHVLFHSLHQFAIPSAASRVFGVPDTEFRAIRRTELSPLEIAALHGRSPGDVLRMCRQILRDRVTAGVDGRAMTAAQGRILLRRQFAQLPRWLGQARYNGPPPTRGGALVAKPRDYASNPQISGDGTRVAFETYRQKLDDLLRRGEIAVETRDVGAGTTAQASPAQLPARPRGPQSSYNATISGDGSLVAFESAAGNQNFGKRYGDIGVFVRDLSAERLSRNLRPRQQGFAASRSAWGPALSADGAHVVYLAVDSTGRVLVRVADLVAGDARTVVRSTAEMTPLEPDISADGSRVAYTAALARGSRVEVVDVATGTVTPVATAPGTFAAQPDISADGRHVAFVAGAAGQEPAAYVGALDGSAPVRVGEAALRPVTSADGKVVAYSAVAAGTSRVLVRDSQPGRPRSSAGPAARAPRPTVPPPTRPSRMTAIASRSSRPRRISTRPSPTTRAGCSSAIAQPARPR